MTTLKSKDIKSEPMFEAEILKPFGPRIGKAKVPDYIIKALNDDCDQIVKSNKKRKSQDASDSLVGHVTEELKLSKPSDYNPKSPVYHFFKYLGELSACLVNEYMKELEKEPFDSYDLEVYSSWYVRSFEKDYNPVHLHASGDYSCVLYLKVPPTISTKNFRNTKEIYTTEGYIDFIFGVTSQLCSGHKQFMPVVGDIYVFPSYLFHTVYPFFGKGERRSLSANFSVLPKTEEIIQ